MLESTALAVVVSYLIQSAPSWLNDLRSILIEKGKQSAVEQAKTHINEYLDQKKQIRHIELALKNAAERGLTQFKTLEERDLYRHVLTILSEPGSHSGSLRREVLRLFVLSDEPRIEELNEIYNLSLRTRALSQKDAPEDVDGARYLLRFFEALITELYKDPFFHDQISDVLKIRAGIAIQRNLSDVISLLHQIDNNIAPSYTSQQFEQDVQKYLVCLERTLRYTKLVAMSHQDRNNNIDPTLDGIFIPLNITPFQPNTSPFHKLPKNASTNSLVSLLEGHSCLVLLGGPGFGKSTSTRHLAWSHAIANLEKPSTIPSFSLLSGSPLPLRIELRHYVEDKKHQPGLNFLTYTSEILLKQENVVIPAKMFEELLERRMVLLLFDGLDEVTTLDERKRLIEEIEHLTIEYPGNRILVTTRPTGYEFAQFSKLWFYHVQTQGFDQDRIHAYLEKWYLHVLRLNPLPYQDQQELELLYNTLIERSRLFTLAKNPLLLSVIAALHRTKRLPDRRVLVYEECTKVMLEIWSQFRGTNKQWNNLLMTEEDQYACIARLGYILQEKSQIKESQEGFLINNNAEDIPASYFLKEIEHFLEQEHLFTDVVQRRAESKLFFKMIEIEAGLIVETGTNEVGDKLFGFIHRTFQEYFAAMDVHERYQKEGDVSIISKFLQTHIFNPHWHEVVLLLLGKLKRKFATTQLLQILDRKNENCLGEYIDILHNDLFFVCFCLTEEISVENQLAEEVIRQLYHLTLKSVCSLQSKEGFKALAALTNTRQYADLAKNTLIKLIDEEVTDDLTKAEIITTAYFTDFNDAVRSKIEISLLNLLHSTNAPFSEIARTLLTSAWQFDDEEKPKIILILCNATLEPTIPFEEALSFYEGIFYENHPEDSNLDFPPIKTFLELLKRQNLTFEQKMNAAKFLNTYLGLSTEGAAELAIKILLELLQEDSITEKQSILAATALYEVSRTTSKEEQIAEQILLKFMQPPHTIVKTTVNIAKELSKSHIAKELIRNLQLIQRLEELLKQPEISFEDIVLINETLCDITPGIPETYQRALEQLFDLSCQKYINLNQRISAIEAFIDKCSIQSNKRKQALQNLVVLLQLPDLTTDQLIHIAQILYRYITSPYSVYSFEEEIIVEIAFEEELRQKFCRLLEHSDLPFTQILSILGFLYKEKLMNHYIMPGTSGNTTRFTSKVSEYIIVPLDRNMAWEIILQLLKKRELKNEQRLQVITLPLNARKPSFADLSYSINWILSVMPKEDAKKYLKENIRIGINPLTFDHYNLKGLDITPMLEILQQEAVPIETRNFIYSEVRRMFPLYWEENTYNDELITLNDHPF